MIMDMKRIIAVALVLCCLAACWSCGGGGIGGSTSELLKGGWVDFTTGDFESSQKKFEGVASRGSATAGQRHSALLGIASCYQLAPNPALEDAKAAFETLAKEELPDAKRDALLGLGQVELAMANGENMKMPERLEHLREARHHLMALLAGYGDSLGADQAVVHLAESYNMPFLTGDEGIFSVPDTATVDKALELLYARVTQGRLPEVRAVLLLMIGKIHVQRGESQKAVTVLKEAEPDLVVPRSRESVIWQIARLSERDLKDKRQALKYYKYYADNFKRSGLWYRATQKVKQLSAELDGSQEQ
jgi:tetratricopeptide (TPR) repeat protein